MKEDVINAVLQFFTTGWMLPSYNTNIIVMIPKALNADTVNQFRPIPLANFMFKNVSKILADILAIIMPRLISHEHKGFIRGRNIKDCICTTYEAINLLHKKAFGGNITFKIDISKAFDTLDWSFLLRVLKAFGFNTKIYEMIKGILPMVRLGKCTKSFTK